MTTGTSWSCLEAALTYCERGWSVTPTSGKQPVLTDWPNRRLRESDIRAIFRPEYNVGVVLGASGLADLDFDDPATVRALKALSPPELEGAAAFEHAGRPHLIVRSPSVQTRRFKRPDGSVLLEVRGEGAQTVFPPSIHPDGEAYVWMRDREPTAVDDDRLWTLAAMLVTVAYASEFWSEGSRHDLSLALAGFLARRIDEGDTMAVVRAIAATGGDVEPRDREQAALTTIRRIRAGLTVTGLPTLSDLAPGLSHALASWWKDEPGRSGMAPGRNGASPDGGPVRFPRTDSGNAELFASLYRDRLRYDHRRKGWLVWASHWWQPDADAEVLRLAKAASRLRYEKALLLEDLDERQAEAKWAISSESRMRLEAALSLAKAERPIADAGDRWDSDPWLLGVANGVVDLRSGALRDGRPEDRITQHVKVPYRAEAKCPRWWAFLEEVFGGDRELIDFIWRALGYSLAGDTSEHCVFICYGAGANGKTTFLNTLRAVAGSYGHNMPFTTIEMQGRSAVPTDVADLAGKRLVTATETNERNRLNESRFKALSGGDPITARHLYSSFFEFRPVAKFWLAVNHKPRVDDDSYGFWRRVRLIPFLRVFRERDADKKLAEKLAAEADGILAWAVQGCLEWQKRGLDPPDAVRAATDEYRDESDPIAGFIADRCVAAAECTVTASALYRAYREWAGDQGLQQWEVLSSTRFGRRMTERFEKRHSDRGNIYAGIGLRAEGLGADLKGSESSGGRITEITPIQSSLAKELDNPSNPSESSGDDGRRLYALSLWREIGSPSPVEMGGHRRIVDVERFLAVASGEEIAIFVTALETRG